MSESLQVDLLQQRRFLYNEETERDRNDTQK